jgi:hypothetical protein
MPSFSLRELLETMGPTSSLIFAAWIFLTFLQQRYTAAFDRYRALVHEFREHDRTDERRTARLKQLVALYKHRCDQMRVATNRGVLSAMMLIGCVIVGALQVCLQYAVPAAENLKYVAAVLGIGGLAMVIASAFMVIRENTSLREAIEGELTDVDDLPELKQP